MKRIALFAIFAMLVFCSVAPLSTPATPTSYALTCSMAPQVGPTPGSVAFYPVPGTGAPDGTDETGKPFADSSKSSCGWVSRAYRAGEQTTLCGGPGLLGGQINVNGSMETLPVYNDGKSCMVVTGRPTVVSAQSYPDITVVCHTPLRSGSAPAASFYSEVEGALSATTNFATLPVGTCASGSAVPLPIAAFCVANDQDAPYKNQLNDLTYTGFYGMVVHADPGCNIYERGTLTSYGTTFPTTRERQPMPVKTMPPATSAPAAPAPTPTPTPTPVR